MVRRDPMFVTMLSCLDVERFPTEADTTTLHQCCAVNAVLVCATKVTMKLIWGGRRACGSTATLWGRLRSSRRR